MLGSRKFTVIRMGAGTYIDGIGYEGVETRFESRGNLQVPNIHADDITRSIHNEYSFAKYVLYTRTKLLYNGDVDGTVIADRIEWMDRRRNMSGRFKIMSLSNWELPGMNLSHLKYTLVREEP